MIIESLYDFLIESSVNSSNVVELQNSCVVLINMFHAKL